MNDGLELNDKKESENYSVQVSREEQNREHILKQEEKDEEYTSLPGWYSPSEKIVTKKEKEDFQKRKSGSSSGGWCICELILGLIALLIFIFTGIRLF